MNVSVAEYMEWSVSNPMADHTCWTFLSKVLKENYGVNIPALAGQENIAAQEKEVIKQQQLSSDWREVAVPAAGDVILFLLGGKRPHVGIMVSDAAFLHFSEIDRTVKLDLHDSLRWRNRVEGFYRHIR